MPNGVFDAEPKDYSIPRFKQARPFRFHTPGEQYPAGKYANEAWNSLLFDKHIELLTKEMQYRRAVGTPSTTERVRRHWKWGKKFISAPPLTNGHNSA